MHKTFEYFFEISGSRRNSKSGAQAATLPRIHPQPYLLGKFRGNFHLGEWKRASSMRILVVRYRVICFSECYVEFRGSYSK